MNWGLNGAVSGIFDPMFCSDSRIKNGKGHLLVCERGIRVAGSFYVSLIDIHFSQILSLEFLPDSKVLEKEKEIFSFLEMCIVDNNYLKDIKKNFNSAEIEKYSVDFTSARYDEIINELILN